MVYAVYLNKGFSPNVAVTDSNVIRAYMSMPRKEDLEELLPYTSTKEQANRATLSPFGIPIKQ